MLELFILFFLLAVSNAEENNAANMARYTMKHTDWVTIATISTIDEIKGYPFANVKSISDGPSGKSTGVPYFFLSDLDLSVIDLQEDQRISVLAVLADTYCKEKKWNPQDPRCPRLMLTGRYEKVEDKEEFELAKKGLWERHPVMEIWNDFHDFSIAKLDIEHVVFLGSFGGAKHIPVEEYLAANPDISPVAPKTEL